MIKRVMSIIYLDMNKQKVYNDGQIAWETNDIKENEVNDKVTADSKQLVRSYLIRPIPTNSENKANQAEDKKQNKVNLYNP